ncbi:muscle M-line assembly protein unc-89-like [Cotesia glomerata]|uniref:Uncharacterized protein n=1 Tax=Cotesia glomerata TaxID=32391 RepID=A0AAV7ISV0_COTGL|nr:muscle M-line assembly protein unc-89-like [Cotesia glomerata]KAH0556603.1 hypothetical protein KQX54_001234 [Cotesia glomerata]
MSLRKVRRGAKTDGEDDKTMEQDTSIIPKTPDDGNRTLRTRRQLKLKNTDESDVIDGTPQLNETKRPGRKPRGKKTTETADDSVNVSVAMSSRKRTRKDKDSNVTLITEDSILTDQTLTKAPVSVKKTRSRKRAVPEKADGDTDDDKKVDDTVVNGREADNVSSIGTQVTLDNDQEEKSKEDVEVKAISKRGRKQVATPINPRTRQLRSRNVNSPNTVVTPESSPITVHLTPHRATKTPRKSPVNIGSPKTHTLSPQRLSKTPRKLSIINDSPISSDLSSNLGTPHTDLSKSLSSRKSAKSTKSPRVSLKSPKSPRVLLKSPKALRVSLRSPKSPRNSLKSPGTPLKSPKSPKVSPKSPKSPGKSLKSPKSPKINQKSKSPRVLSTKIIKSPKNGPATPVKSPSPNKSPSKQPLIESQKINDKIRSPQLVLRKLSPRKTLENVLETPISNSSILENLPEKPASPRRAKPTAIKRSSITTSGTPLRPIPTPKHNDSKKSAHKSFVGDTNTPLTLFAMKHGSGLMSSTPREKIRRSLNLSLNSFQNVDLRDSPFSVQSFYGKTSPRTSSRIHNDSTFSKIADETNPLITDDESLEMSGIKTVEQSQQDVVTGKQDSLISEDSNENLNNTYELAEPQTPGLKKNKNKNKNKNKKEKEEETSGNDTYELDEPKTPALRKKRTEVETSIIAAADVADEKGAKRVCRVRFASPSVNSISAVTEKTKDIATRTATPGKATLKKTGFVTIRNPTKTNKISPRRRSSSLSNILRPKPSAKKRSLSTIDLSRSAQKTLQNESVNRLSRARHSVQSDKKPEVKPMSARKVPNFAQIHQKKFEQMESVVDAKKRVETRHNTLTNNLQVASTSVSKLVTPNTLKTASRQIKAPVATDKGVSPGDTVNGVFNRFGYKVRKEEATKIVNKKLPTKTSEEKKTEKRTILKGVRSNRRFEMLMNLRRMNQ